jgi:hypothetical protein
MDVTLSLSSSPSSSLLMPAELRVTLGRDFGAASAAEARVAGSLSVVSPSVVSPLSSADGISAAASLALRDGSRDRRLVADTARAPALSSLEDARLFFTRRRGFFTPAGCVGLSAAGGGSLAFLLTAFGEAAAAAVASMTA